MRYESIVSTIRLLDLIVTIYIIDVQPYKLQWHSDALGWLLTPDNEYYVTLFLKAKAPEKGAFAIQYLIYLIFLTRCLCGNNLLSGEANVCCSLRSCWV